jgi:hypothetical protein
VAAKDKQATANNEQLLQMGINAAKQGQNDGARVTLMEVYNRDKRNERAMLWLAQVARTTNEREMWLRRVLKVNPDNPTARKALKKLQYKGAARENRTLLIFGAVLAVMLVIMIAVLIILFVVPRV